MYVKYSLYIRSGESSLENSLSLIWKELEMLIYDIVSVDPQIVIYFFHYL